MLSVSSVQTSRFSTTEPLALSSHERGWNTPLKAVVIVQISMSRKYCPIVLEKETGRVRLVLQKTAKDCISPTTENKHDVLQSCQRGAPFRECPVQRVGVTD